MKTGRRIEELVAAASRRRAPAEARLRPGAVAGRGEGAGAGAARRRSSPARSSDAARRATTGCTRSSSTATGRWRFRRRAAVRLVTRGGLDWTHRYGDLADAFAALPCREAVVDGEIVVQDDGRHQPLRAAAGRAVARGAERARVLRLRPGAARRVEPDRRAARRGARSCSRSSSPGATGGRRSSISDHVRGGGRGVLRAGLARSGSRGWCRSAPTAPYQPGRSKTWTKAQGEARRRLRDRGLHRVGRRRAGSGRWRSGSGSRASSSIAARSGPGSTRATLADLLARLGPLEDPGLAHRRGAEGCPSGCGRSIRRGSSIRT